MTNIGAAATGERNGLFYILRFGDIAEIEGFSDVAVAFHKITEVEKNHDERYKIGECTRE